MIPKLHNLHTYNGLQFCTGTVPLCDNSSLRRQVYTIQTYPGQYQSMCTVDFYCFMMLLGNQLPSYLNFIVQPILC